MNSIYGGGVKKVLMVLAAELPPYTATYAPLLEKMPSRTSDTNGSGAMAAYERKRKIPRRQLIERPNRPKVLEDDDSDTDSTARTPRLSDYRTRELEAFQPFRQVALEQLPASGSRIATPTVVLEMPEEARTDKDSRSKNHGTVESKSRPKFSALDAAGIADAPPLSVDSAMSPAMQIHAHTVNVYNTTPSTCQNCVRTGQGAANFQSGLASRTTVANQIQQPAPASLMVAAWKMGKGLSHPDVPVDELGFGRSPPHGYAAGGGHQLPKSKHALGDVPMTGTAPPARMYKHHPKEMLNFHFRLHPDSGIQQNIAAGGLSGIRGEHNVENSKLFKEQIAACPKGKAECTCTLDLMEAFKDVATYIYKHTRTLKQDFFQAHVHAGERIERLQQMNAQVGGTTLPARVHKFLQLETTRLLMDWADAESECANYICDCIVADVNTIQDVNANQVQQPCGATANCTPSDVTEADGTGACDDTAEETPQVSETSSASASLPQIQRCQRFAELKRTLQCLTERSEKIKNQWSNLLDLCNELNEVAEVGETTTPAELEDDHSCMRYNQEDSKHDDGAEPSAASDAAEM